jgi:hypothetical protein
LGFKRITTSEPDLPDYSIKTIFNFLVEMKQHFIDGKIDFDSIINGYITGTSIYITKVKDSAVLLMTVFCTTKSVLLVNGRAAGFHFFKDI